MPARAECIRSKQLFAFPFQLAHLFFTFVVLTEEAVREVVSG